MCKLLCARYYVQATMCTQTCACNHMTQVSRIVYIVVCV